MPPYRVDCRGTWLARLVAFNRVRPVAWAGPFIVGPVTTLLVFGLFVATLALAKHANAQQALSASSREDFTAPVIQYVPGSTVKLEQLLGEEDKERHHPTRSRTISRYRLEGTDLGYSFDHQGHTYF
jgi:hypothetical protein